MSTTTSGPDGQPIGLVLAALQREFSGICDIQGSAETAAWEAVRRVGPSTHILVSFTLEDLAAKIEAAGWREEMRHR